MVLKVQPSECARVQKLCDWMYKNMPMKEWGEMRILIKVHELVLKCENVAWWK